MNANGRGCSIIFQIGSRILSLPYSAETLRDVPSLVMRKALLERERDYAEGGRIGAAGCVVSPLTITNASALLAFAFGTEDEAEWVSETRSLHRHRLAQSYDSNKPKTDIIQNRVAYVRRYRNLSCVGYELRGATDERIQLKLDLSADQGSEAAGYYLDAGLKQEEFFRLDAASLRVNGEPCSGCYAFSLKVHKIEGSAEIRLHATLNETNGRLLGSPRLDEVVLCFALRRDAYEVGRFGRFTVSCRDLLLLSDETIIDAADEVIGPRRFLIRGQLSAEVFTTDGGRLLP